MASGAMSVSLMKPNLSWSFSSLAWAKAPDGKAALTADRRAAVAAVADADLMTSRRVGPGESVAALVLRVIRGVVPSPFQWARGRALRVSLGPNKKSRIPEARLRGVFLG